MRGAIQVGFTPPSTELHDKFQQREAREIERLGQVLRLVTSNSCQWAALSEYFNDPIPEPCDHCTWCGNDRKALSLPSRTRPAADPTTLQQAHALRAKHPKELSEPESLARFLCGIRSPWLTRAKLTGNPLFGALAQVPFLDVLDLLDIRSDE